MTKPFPKFIEVGYGEKCQNRKICSDEFCYVRTTRWECREPFTCESYLEKCTRPPEEPRVGLSDLEVTQTGD